MEKLKLRFKFQGFDSIYGLTTLADETARKVMVVVTELPENKGKSVTNAYDVIATEVFYDRLSHISPEDIRWIEHYTDTTLRVMAFVYAGMRVFKMSSILLPS